MPVSVIAAVPGVAAAPAASVSVLVALVLLGLNVAVTPLGNPDALNTTFALKPFCGDTLTVALPLEPCATIRLPGDVDNEKSG